MKNTSKLLMLAMVIASIIGCSKKSSPTPTTISIEKEIVGKWYYSSDTVIQYINGKITLDDPTGGVNSTYYQQFNSDGTGSAGNGSDPTIAHFTFTISGNQLTTNTPAFEDQGFLIPASVETATIKSVTSSELYLYYDDKETDGGTTSETMEAEHFVK